MNSGLTIPSWAMNHLLLNEPRWRLLLFFITVTIAIGFVTGCDGIEEEAPRQQATPEGESSPAKAEPAQAVPPARAAQAATPVRRTPLVHSRYRRALLSVPERCLFLDLDDQKAHQTFLVYGSLFREIARQSILLAGREELRLATRDVALREEFPWSQEPYVKLLRNPTVIWPLSVATTVNADYTATVTVFQRSPAAKPAWEKQFTLDRETPYCSFVAQLEPLLSTEVREVLGKQGFAGEPRDWNPEAGVPEDVDQLLGEFTVISQYAAVRRLHHLIDQSGESAPRLGALARGYVHLSRLTNRLMGPFHKVFMARALLYAERMVRKSEQAPVALWNRAYVRGWIGLPGDALADVALARRGKTAETPAWASLLDPFCRADLQALRKASTDEGGRPEAPLLYWMLQESRSNSDSAYDALGLVLNRHPNCLSALNAVAWIQSLGTRAVAQETLRRMPEIVGSDLAKVEDLPEGLRKRLSNSSEWTGEDLAAIVQDLKAAGKGGLDRGEPSLDFLGQLIRELTFLAAWQSLDYEKNALGVPIQDSLKKLRPFYQSHPYALAIVALGQNGEERQKTANQWSASIDPAQLEYVCLVPLGTVTFTERHRAGNLHYVALEHLDQIYLELLARASTETQDSEARLDALHRVQRMAPNHPAAIEWRIHLEPSTTLADLPRWEQQFAEDVSLQKMLALAYLHLGQVEAAERCNARWLAELPSYEAYLQRAQLHALRDDHDHWLAALHKSLEFPVAGLEHARVRIRISEYHLAREEPQKAEPHAEAAAQTGAGWAMLGAGKVKEQLKKWEEAEQYYRAVSLRYEGSGDDWLFWCLRTGHGDLEAATEPALRWAEARAVKSQSNTNRLRAALIFVIGGRERAGLEEILALARETQDPHYLWHALALAGDLGEDQQARQLLQTLVQIDPLKDREAILPGTLPLARHLLERLEANRPGELDWAWIDQQIAGMPSANPTTVWYFLGQYLSAHGQQEQALRYLKQSASSPLVSAWTQQLASYVLHKAGFDLPPRRPADLTLPETLPNATQAVIFRHESPLKRGQILDEKRIATCDASGTLRVWDVERQSVLETIDLQGDFINASDDGKWAASVSQEGHRLELWELGQKAQRPQRTISGPGAVLTSGGFLRGKPEGLVTLHWHYRSDSRPEPFVAFWDQKSPTDKPRWQADFDNQNVYLLDGTSNGEELVVLLRGQEETSRILKLSALDGRVTKTLEFSGHPIALADQSADRSTLVSISVYGDLIVWNADLKPAGQFFIPHVSALAVSPDGSRLAFGHENGELSLWDLKSGREIARIREHFRGISGLEFRADGKQLLSCGHDLTARLWDVERVLAWTADQKNVPAFSWFTIKNSLGLSLAPVPAGEFLMGEHEQFQHVPGYKIQDVKNHKPRHRVEITRPFYLSQFEVTVGQFRQFVDATKYVTEAESSGKGGRHLIAPQKQSQQLPHLNWRNPGFEQKDDHPVVHVTWNDAQAFCRWLSEKEGKTYRLPTEAEWERACRGHFGDRTAASKEGRPRENVADRSIGNVYQNYEVAASWSDGYPFTSAVGTYPPNSLGLFDVRGNVFEWCQDYFDETYYQRSPSQNPPGPAKGTYRVQRGGSFMHHVEDSRAAYRDRDRPDQPDSCVGFRVLLEM